MGDAEGGGLLCFHAAAECFDTAQNEPGIERGAGEAEGIADPGDAFGGFGGCGDDAAANDIGVSVDVFGGGVDDDVDAEFDGALEVGGKKGVVAD